MVRTSKKQTHEQIDKVVDSLRENEFDIHDSLCDMFESDLEPNAVKRVQEAHNRWHELHDSLRHLQLRLGNPNYKNRDLARAPCPECGVWRKVPLTHGAVEMCDCPVFNQDN